MSVVAIIPARGGSKGVPKKNIRELAGKPLIAYTILSALSTPKIDRVIVSTDDEDIVEISKKYGAEVIMRPTELSGDDASSESALKHVVETLEERGDDVDVIVFLQCTSPLRGADVIIRAIDKLQDTGADSVISVHRDHGYYGIVEGGDRYTPFRTDRLPRQKMDSRYCDNGAVYVLKRDVLKRGRRYGTDVRVVDMPKENSFEIDTEFDFWLVEQVMIKLTNSTKK